MNPLLHAAKNGNLEEVKRHVMSGKVCQALLLSCDNGHTEVARFLLTRGAKVDASCLYVASSYGHTETVRLLLQSRVFEECHDKLNEALRMAANRRRTDTVRVLLAHKADAHTHGHFLTHECAVMGLTQMCEVFLEAGGPSLAQYMTPSFHRQADLSHVHTVARLMRLYRADKSIVHALMNLDAHKLSTPFTVATFMTGLDDIVDSLLLLLSSSRCCRDLCELIVLHV